MNIPLQPDNGNVLNLRSPDRSKAAPFPAEFEKKPKGPAAHN
jgi:hypothetical protein